MKSGYEVDNIIGVDRSPSILYTSRMVRHVAPSNFNSNGEYNMNEEATVEKAEPLVNIKRENYVTARTASGGKSLHNDDAVAQGLQGLNIDELYDIAGKFLVFPLKVKGAAVESIGDLGKVYADLNVGMQRMNLGNRIRSRVTKIDTDIEKAATKAKADGKEPLATKSGADKLTTILAPFTKARVERDAKAEKAKTAADAEKAKEAKSAKTDKAA